MVRKLIMALPIVALAVGGSTACATKKFVRTSVADVNDKVDSLGRSVEETQERTRQNEGKINDVDQKAQAAQQQANQANTAAQQAQQAANTAGTKADTVAARADAMDKASKRLVYEVVLNEDEGNFKFGKADLPDEAKAKIDQIIEQLKQDPKAAYFEIEGHTDNVGPADVNEKIGLARAEAVKKYLYEQHQIPLFKMNVISYGEEKPIAPNNTKDGRAQNRRVVIRILA
jgi:outer membrane protein OmpA-like peptidoglycan-associated protein